MKMIAIPTKEIIKNPTVKFQNYGEVQVLDHKKARNPDFLKIIFDSMNLSELR